MNQSLVIVLTGLFALSSFRGLAAAGPAQKDIVETAISAEFKTLVKAVQAAGLVDTLKGKGPFTVFAPTDKAFAAVPKEKLEALLKDKKALSAVLTYHVVGDRVTASDVVKLREAKTLQGEKLKIEAKDGKVRINAASVVKADIHCTNGVIHVIDAVLLPPDPRAAAAALIHQALGNAGDQTNDESTATELRAAAAEVLRLLPHNALVQSLLEDFAAAPAASPPKSNSEMRSALVSAAEILNFAPTVEAEAPAGFPQPTPVGDIELKRYPSYRLARTDMSRDTSDDSAFFTLFRHIASNQIAMTAPVEMTYGSGKNERLRPQAMAFLYENPRIGKVGQQADVGVADIPQMTVVSIGMRGDHSEMQIDKAHDLLKSWLQKHSGAYQTSGPLRVMGHNSPMVPVAQRYFEVQIPIREKAAAP